MKTETKVTLLSQVGATICRKNTKSLQTSEKKTKIFRKLFTCFFTIILSIDFKIWHDKEMNNEMNNEIGLLWDNKK